jgi:hypothetical protein
MKTYQLCTYHFRSAESASRIALKWPEYIEYLRDAGFETHGVFRSLARPNSIIALIGYEDELEQLALKSIAFTKFLAGLAEIDVEQIIRVDDLPLRPLGASPL